jgi:hypothetical protein
VCSIGSWTGVKSFTPDDIGLHLQFLPQHTRRVWVDEIIQELQAVSVEGSHTFEVLQLTNPDNKWLVRSAFQKAIRRGETERAIRMGGYLYGVDPTYAWQSLAVIAIEDVGFGDLDTVAYSTLTTLKSLRDQLHAELLFGAMIERLCAADKSRSCCELSLGAEIAEKATFAEFQTMPDDLLMETMLDNDPKVGYVAASVLRKRLRKQGPEVLQPVLEMIRDNLTTDRMRRAAMCSFERTVDGMNLALFPILLWMERGAGKGVMPYVEQALWPPEEEIMSVSTAAYDMHTLQGKKAIKAFWSTMKKDYPEFETIPGDKVVRAIGSLVFICEGGMLDRRIVNANLWGLKQYQDMNFAIGWGCPAETREILLKIVWENIPLLNEKRKWAATLS